MASGGLYQWKRDGEFHLWNPESIASLQDAVRGNDIKRFQEFSHILDNDMERSITGWKNDPTGQALTGYRDAKAMVAMRHEIYDDGSLQDFITHNGDTIPMLDRIFADETCSRLSIFPSRRRKEFSNSLKSFISVYHRCWFYNF